MDRRDFLKTATVAAAGSVAPAGAQNAQPSNVTVRPESPNMIYRELGRTGERVSAIGIGGYHLGKQQDPDESIRLFRAAIDRGITFMDNCWDYNGGISEVRMGQALRDGYRQKVFLMTKIDGRDKNTAARQIEQSLGRLQTDAIDLLQFHEVIRLDDPDVIFAAGGAIEAVQEAKQAGKIRFIGFTGHKDPSVHLRMFETADKHGFHFDTVQMPINVMDAHFRSFLNGVVPVAQEHGTAILAMKTFGDPYILQSNTVTPMEALHFGLNSPASVVITGIDSEAILDQAFEAVESFKPMDQQQVAAILAKTKEAAMTGKFELFKTSSHYDGTIKNPSWLGYTSG
ncbi:MAG TPA: aldo/keto reductase [Terracidiphilus sp.]|jgi:aryl-alcohol dehydrogenase-like predicted oxidoreductase